MRAAGTLASRSSATEVDPKMDVRSPSGIVETTRTETSDSMTRGTTHAAATLTALTGIAAEEDF